MRNSTKLVNLLLIFLFLFLQQSLFAQTGVINPNDTVVTYNPAAPPTLPPAGVMAKWVRTVRQSYNTSDFKCYIYDGIQFRLKFPTNYATAPAGTKFPLYLFFHGVGEIGTVYDNENQLTHGGDVHQAAVNNGTFDGFLLYPQCSNSSGVFGPDQWGYIEQIIVNYLVPQCNVDINRIVVDGLSGGGQSVWGFTQTFPTIVAASLPISSVETYYTEYIPSLRFTPMWLFQGGLDGSPVPQTAIYVENAFLAAGAPFTFTEYMTEGHSCWDSAWAMPGYYPYLNAAHKANPTVLYGKTAFCPTDVIQDTLGVTAGFTSYQWRKNGVVIPGANSNILVVNSVGTYDCSIERGTSWSVFSPIPAVISLQTPTVPPTIGVNGLTSYVVPAPDGSTTAQLAVPNTFATYNWQNVNSPTTLSTTNVLTGAVPGSYDVAVTQKFGCASAASAPFTVVNANGANGPGKPVNVSDTVLSKTQILLTWSEPPSQAYPETNYEIYQATAAGGPYKLIALTPHGVLADTVGGLNPNTTYYFEIRGINNNGASGTVQASALTQGDFTPPTSPGNLRAGLISPTSIQLVWDSATDNVGVVAYDIYINGTKAYSIGDVSTFTAYNLVDGQTYNFMVKARDFAGNVSPASNQLTATAGFSGLNYNYYVLSSQPSVMPNFPTLTPTSSGNMPNVSIANATATTDFAYQWNGFINIPVTGNYVFQTVSDDGSQVWLGGLNQTASPYSFSGTPIVNANQPQGATATNSATLMLQAGVYPISIAYFQAAGGYSMALNWQTPQTGGSFVAIPNSAFVQAGPVLGPVPAAPSGLTATAVTAEKITLNWQDNSSNETGFQIYRSTSATGPFTTVGTTKANVTTFNDSTLTAATTYYYKVNAIGQNGTSPFNSQDSSTLTYNFYNNFTATTVSAIPALTPTSTGTSTNFTLAVTTATSNFALQFNGYINIATAGSYTFYTNSDDGSNLSIDGHVVVNNDNPHAPQQAQGTVSLTAGRHAIQVNYFQNGGGQQLIVSWAGPGISMVTIPDSVLTISPINATTLPLPSLPLAPDSLTGSNTIAQRIILNWSNPSTNSTRNVLYRSVGNNAGFSVLATLAPTVTSYVDSNLSALTAYYYKIQAVNEAGTSPYSNVLIDTTIANPASVVTIDSITNVAMVNDSTALLNIIATTNLGSSLTYVSGSLPFVTAATNSNGTYTLTIKPNSMQLGVYTDTVTVTDNFGSVATKYFTITVTGRNAVTTYINFNQSLPQGAPWNNTNAVPYSGTTIANLVNANAVQTGITLTLLDTWSGYASNGPITGNNSGAVPDNVMKTSYYGSTAGMDYRIQLTNVPINKKYSVVFFATRVSSTPIMTNYTIGSTTVSLNAADNASNTVQINGVSPDSTGTILVIVTKPTGSPNAFISAMELQAYDYDSTPPPPTNLVASGITPSAISLSWTAPQDDTRSEFEIWRSNTGFDNSFSLYTTVGKDATSFADSNLQANSTYFYEVRAVGSTLKSAFSNVAGGSTLQYTVELAFNSQPTFAEASPWNNINTLIPNVFTLPNMINSQKDSTGINFNIIENFAGYNTIGLTTGNNSGVVPDTVMKDFYYTNYADTAKFSISGLSQTSIYNFVFFASSNLSQATNTVYVIGNQTASLNAENNTTRLATIYNCIPDSTGTVYVKLYSSVGYGYLGALMIQGMPLPAAVAAGINDTASGLSTTRTDILAQASAITAGIDSSAGQINTSLAAFPNPFTDNITVRFDFKQNVSTFAVVFVDMSGRVVQENQFSDVPAGTWIQNIDVSKFPTGTYVMQILGVTGDKIAPFKLIKLKK